MNTNMRKTNNGNTKGEPKSFTPQEVERSGIEGPLSSSPGGQRGVRPYLRRVDPRGPWHRPRFVHGPGSSGRPWPRLKISDTLPGRGARYLRSRIGGLR